MKSFDYSSLPFPDLSSVLSALRTCAFRSRVCRVSCVVFLPIDSEIPAQRCRAGIASSFFASFCLLELLYVEVFAMSEHPKVQKPGGRYVRCFEK